MGLFDFFKKNNKEKEPTSSLFDSFQPYSTYLLLYISMQSQGNYAPIAAYEKTNGELEGFLYVHGEDESYAFTATETVRRMKERLEQQLQEGEILSYAILYHSPFNKDNNHAVATSQHELKAISIAYHFQKEGKGAVGLPYVFKQDDVTYARISNFSREENSSFFKITLEQDKDYFQDRIEIVPPSFENEIGLTIKKSNVHTLQNTWSGIFGFDSYGSGQYAQIMQEHSAIAFNKPAVVEQKDIVVSELDYQDITFKAVSYKGNFTSILPIVKTDYALDFETKEIQEWENVYDLEAIVAGRGRDTFGLWFFATDYAENKAKYRSQKNFSIHVSGIAFVIDKHQTEPNEDGEGPQYSDDFTAYLPSQDLPQYACFDFVGELEAFRTTQLLEDNSHKGFILTVRLITNPDQKDFFTLDIYATPENMRVKELEVGMKLTGMFQMQGRMVVSTVLNA